MGSRARRLLISITLLGLMSSSSATCQDARASAWSGVSDMMSAAPIFMQDGINSICTKAARIASAKLPKTCPRTTAALKDAAAGGCAAVYASLSSAAQTGDCLCVAVIAFADAAQTIKLLHNGAPVEIDDASMARPMLMMLLGAVAAAMMARRMNGKHHMVFL